MYFYKYPFFFGSDMSARVLNGGLEGYVVVKAFI